MVFAMSRAIACFLFSLLVSTILTRFVFQALRSDGAPSVRFSPSLDFLIRFFETGLVFIFVIEREYTALAVLLAADLLVRRNRISEDPVEHLLNPLTVFTVATVFAIIARAWMSKFLAILIV
jgi:uncharacterized membrane protein